MKKIFVLLALVAAVAIPARAQVITGFGTTQINPVNPVLDFNAPWTAAQATVSTTSLTVTSIPDQTGGMGEFFGTPITLIDGTPATLTLLLTGELEAAPPSAPPFQITLYDNNFNTLLFTGSWDSFSQTSILTDALTNPSEGAGNTSPFDGEVAAWTLSVGGETTDTLSFQFDELQAVPEPSTYAMFGIGLVALYGWQRRSKTRLS